MPEIRKTTLSDLPALEKIFAHARQQMAAQGNPTQWGSDRPDLKLIENDIARGDSYVIVEKDEIVGTFAFVIGIDETYLDIDGAWLNDRPYGTIHRIASSGKIHGIFEQALQFAQRSGIDLRIDTHKDNKIMLHLIEKNGFKRCGIITVDDGTKRIAYQKTL